MTVRFSGIFRKTDKKSPELPSSQQDIQIQKLRIDDFQLMDVEDPQDVSDFLLGDRYGGNVQAYYNQLLEEAQLVREQVKEDKTISPSSVLSILQCLIREELIEQLYEYGIYLHSERGLPSHAVSVTLASLKVGKGMGYDTEKLLELGLAAFLENVGMYKIPENILKKEGPLSEDEAAAIKRHPESSELIIAQMGDTFRWLAEVVVEVQERSDGSGYPRGLKGEKISEYASIIGLIDTYVAMIMHRPYRKKHTQSEAVKSIIESEKNKFSRKVFKAFLNQISLYPVNTCVRLNNRAIGIVRSTDRSQLLRPTIELLYDGLGRKIEKQKIIRLSEFPLLNIVDTIGEKELAGQKFE